MKWLEEQEESHEYSYGQQAAFLKTELALVFMPGADVKVVGKSGKFEPEELNEILNENDEEYEEYI